MSEEQDNPAPENTEPQPPTDPAEQAPGEPEAQAPAEQDATAPGGQDEGGATIGPVQLKDFDEGAGPGQSRGIDLLSDVNLNVKIELGRTRLLVEDVLKLADGAVIELDKLAGDPVDVYVNERRIARGEVLVVNDNFCVRISEIFCEDGLPAQKRVS